MSFGGFSGGPGFGGPDFGGPGFGGFGGFGGKGPWGLKRAAFVTGALLLDGPADAAQIDKGIPVVAFNSGFDNFKQMGAD